MDYQLRQQMSVMCEMGYSELTRRGTWKQSSTIQYLSYDYKNGPFSYFLLHQISFYLTAIFLFITQSFNIIMQNQYKSGTEEKPKTKNIHRGNNKNHSCFTPFINYTTGFLEKIRFTTLDTQVHRVIFASELIKRIVI